jgi:hypothetical protein
MLATAMPDDWLCRKLVQITEAALDRHYGAHAPTIVEGEPVQAAEAILPGARP